MLPLSSGRVTPLLPRLFFWVALLSTTFCIFSPWLADYGWQSGPSAPQLTCDQPSGHRRGFSGRLYIPAGWFSEPAAGCRITLLLRIQSRMAAAEGSKKKICFFRKESMRSIRWSKVHPTDLQGNFLRQGGANPFWDYLGLFFLYSAGFHAAPTEVLLSRYDSARFRRARPFPGRKPSGAKRKFLTENPSQVRSLSPERRLSSWLPQPTGSFRQAGKRFWFALQRRRTADSPFI